jgi:hypothetical protein
MNIISYRSGSLIALFPMEEFSPLKTVNEKHVLDKISEIYKFGKSPNISVSRDELQKSGLVFETGFHDTPDGTATIIQFSVHNDGVIIRASTTDQAENFFMELKEWLVNEYDFRPVPVNSMYMSEIVVDFEKPLSNAFKDFEKILNIVTTKVSESREVISSSLQGFSIEFSEKSNIPRFFIERRVGSDIKQERYFCGAPLKTKDHVEVLGEIERLLS